MNMSSVTRRIARIRRKIRVLCVVDGVFRIVVAVALLLLLSFVLDSTLDVPLEVRYASAAIAIFAVGAVGIRYLALPLLARITDDDLALAVEARSPGFRDRLISALQFQKRLDDPAEAESKAMMAAVVQEAMDLETEVGKSRLFDMRRIRTAGLAAAAGVAAMTGVFLLMPGVAGIWAKRNLLLENMAWPRATTMVVTGFPASRRVVITRGESLTVTAHARGEIPSDAQVWYQSLDRPGDRDHRQMFQVEGTPSEFRFVFRQVPGSFEFWVTGGDDRDERPLYTVRALDSPTVERATARCVFPPYTGMKPKTYHETDLEVPVGTKLHVSFEMNMPLLSAELRRDTAKPLALTLAPGGKSATIDLVARETMHFSVRMKGRQGQMNPPGSAPFHVMAVADRKPEARVLYPDARLWCTPEGLVPFKVLGSDNYGVSRLSIFFRKGEKGSFTERRFKASEEHELDGPREVVGYVALPLAEIAGPESGLRNGDEITYFAQAVDNDGNIDHTDTYRIEVVAKEDLERKLAQEQTSMREDLQSARREQESAFSGTGDLLDFLAKAGKLTRRDADRVQDIEISQAKVTRDMDRLFDSTARVFNERLYNRLGTPLATERLLGMFDDFLASDEKDVTHVFKRRLYQQVIAEYRSGHIYGDDVLSVLADIMDILSEISGKKSPQAHAILLALAKNDTGKGVEPGLEKVHELQKEILDDFDALDRKMRRWESYEEIIQFMRDLQNLEQGVKTGAQEILKEQRK